MPVPIEWWGARLCEEFHCLPSQALAEWERAPCGLLETIIEMRAFAAMKAALDRAETLKERPTGRLADLVADIEFARAAALMEARRRGGSTDD